MYVHREFIFIIFPPAQTGLHYGIMVAPESAVDLNATVIEVVMRINVLRILVFFVRRELT